MDPRRLRLLLELSRRGSMRAVADELGYTTSTVSQQLAVLAREAGATLIQPEGRRLRIHEHEPAEAFELLAADEVDLALTYDYTLAPLALDPALRVTPLWSAAWGLGVATLDDAAGEPAQDDAPAVFRRFAGAGWIVNSRNTADEQVVRTIASLAGFQPRIAHPGGSP